MEIIELHDPMELGASYSPVLLFIHRGQSLRKSCYRINEVRVIRKRLGMSLQICMY